jgi:hypothetical protein
MYTTEIVENLLRAYYSLQSHPDSTFSDYKIDLDNGLKALEKYNTTLYFTIVNVFVSGMPIQDQALNDGVTPRMVSYRLNDGLSTLTKIMNGEFGNEG